MDDIERLIDEKRHELESGLQEAFHKDSKNVAAMLITALRREFGDGKGNILKDREQACADALKLLPRGSTARPPAYLLSEQPAFRVSFGEYRSSKLFDTKEEAEKYVTYFLTRFREETLPS